MCNLHWCYTFCTGVTFFALVLHFNCTALSQSESSNFFMCVINAVNETKCSLRYLSRLHLSIFCCNLFMNDVLNSTLRVIESK